MATREKKAGARRSAKQDATCDETETSAFVDTLRRHDQLHEGDGPLPPGTTHVVKKAAKGKPATVVRKRFSAL